MASPFGPIVDAVSVEESVKDHLKNWMPTYLAELERRLDIDPGTLPQVRSWTTTPRAPEKWTDDGLPAVLVVSPGEARDPRVQGDGRVSTFPNIGIAVIVSARTPEETDAFAKRYFAELRRIMYQHSSIGGIAEGVAGGAADYDQIPNESRRTLASGYGVFVVEIPEALNARMGLSEPPDDPYDVPDLPTVEETDLEVSKP